MPVHHLKGMGRVVLSSPSRERIEAKRPPGPLTLTLHPLEEFENRSDAVTKKSLAIPPMCFTNKLGDCPRVFSTPSLFNPGAEVVR